MIDSKGSVVVCGQGSHDGLAGVPVVPDGGGQGEDALQDSNGDAGDGASAVLFEIELAFEGVVDRFDALSYCPQQARTGACRFGAVGGSHDSATAVVEPGFRIAVSVALVDDQDQPIRVVKHVRLQGDQIDEDLTFVSFGVAQSERDGQAGHVGDQGQPQTPEEPGVRGAVAIAGPAGQVGTLNRLAGHAARHRGGVGDPDRVAPQVGVGDQYRDEMADLGAQTPQAFVVAGLLGQVGKQVDDRLAGKTNPATLVVEPEQRLHHRHRDQLGVGDLRGDPDPRPPPVELRRRLQLVVDPDVE